MNRPLSELVREAGVVGAGGAGFPAHIKVSSSADTVIANGAECEPLLHKDLALMIREPEAVIDGLRLLMEGVGARRGIVGVKKKHMHHLGRLAAYAKTHGVEIHELGDFYPTGDEYVLVYEATQRHIPPQGIPLNVGVVVNNVETLRNIARAAAQEPVTTKYVTVAGAVRSPRTMEVPVGTGFADLIAAAGGATTDAFALFAGGLMMGKIGTDVNAPVTKTFAGMVILPSDHRLVTRMSIPVSAMHRIGKSACDQCSFCTEFCPRYLLGYDVQPHKVMRSLGFTATGEDIWNAHAQLCCSCGLCTLYACPEDLFPKEACDKSKVDFKALGLAWQGPKEVAAHPMYDGRHVPLGRLMRKLGIEAYDHPAEFIEGLPAPASVTLPLSQHVGAAARPVVKPGDRVRRGAVIGEHAGKDPAAVIHASIDGRVRSVTDSIVIERS
jgi:Na+-translocating ferredoxin:NAD+ oxidoreductase RnfC subunit